MSTDHPSAGEVRATRRQAIAAGLAGLLTTAKGQEPAAEKKVPAQDKRPSIDLPPDAVTGPMVGHTSHEDAHLWIRPAKQGMVTLIVEEAKAKPAERRFTANATAEHDLCVSIHVPGLAPETSYSYRFEQGGKELGAGTFRTWSAPEKAAKVTLAFGSCAHNESSPVWTQMQQSGCEAIVFMGDTPYIDKYDLSVIRRRHREFLHIPELKPLLTRMPVWGTWDDHDFGLNSHLGNSNPAGKNLTRQGFVEYRALAHHGENDAGVYTRFRTGPLEVWLLDPRWFSMTEPSPVNAKQPTCFGAVQWKWLLTTLKASTAPFKLLAMGEIWQDKMNRETDDMGTFPHEREALCDYIRAEKIPGVMLFGGDIHCSRHLCSKGRAGYDLHEFVSSPIHSSIIPSLNVPHPDLVWGHPEPRSFLRLTADTTASPGRVAATFLNAAGKVLHEVNLTSADLTPA